MRQLLILVLVVFCASVQAGDITQQVRINTDFDEKIANACTNKCGNRGFSRLETVFVDPSRTNIHRVTARITAQYHEYAYPTNVLGAKIGGGTILFYTIQVIAYGDLDVNTCYVTITNVDIRGDQLGIANGARDMVGERHFLNNCRQFI